MPLHLPILKSCIHFYDSPKDTLSLWVMIFIGKRYSRGFSLDPTYYESPNSIYQMPVWDSANYTPRGLEVSTELVHWLCEPTMS